MVAIQLSFGIGESFADEITSLARYRAHDEHEWELARYTLTAVCIGMTNYQAMEVIRGNKKLELEFINEEDAKLVMVDDNWSPLERFSLDNDFEKGTFDAWVSPDGDVFRCLMEGHIGLAGKLVDTVLTWSFEGNDYQIQETDERTLESFGWLKLSGGGWRFYPRRGDKLLTDAQIDVIMTWAEKMNRGRSKIPWNRYSIELSEIFETKGDNIW